MDTRFWGPSAWRLLHLITFAYDPETQKKDVEQLFKNLPYILPCKYCRKHLAGHMEKFPLTEDVLKDAESLSRWLWNVHNAVNDMLHKKDPNPSYEAVAKIYKERLERGCSRVEFEGWDFLFSVVENHPFTHALRSSTPIEGAPKKAKRALTRNKWNMMRSRERFPFYKNFWMSLGKSLPFEEWRSAWAACEMKEGAMKSRGALIHELWRIRKCLEKKLDLINKESFELVCKRLETFCVSKPRGRKLTRRKRIV